MIQKERVIIVGGGLSGILLSYLLLKKNISSIILEASSQCGGRIQTIHGKQNTPLELGATWISTDHIHLLNLLEDLNMTLFPQHVDGKSFFQTHQDRPIQEFYVPASEHPSYRISGGTNSIIHRLIQEFPKNRIKLNTPALKIEEKGTKLMIRSTEDRHFEGEKVVLCMPPQLIDSSIQFSPNLPHKIAQILPNVQTWMAGSMKFVIEYSSNFWRNQGFSGMLFSHVGLIMEMHDHNNIENDKFGFTGFLRPESNLYSPEKRKEMVLNQIVNILGESAYQATFYADKIWDDKFLLNGAAPIAQPHLNNGHRVFQDAYFNEKLYFSNTETSSVHPGYMEGAVISALKTAEKIAQK